MAASDFTCASLPPAAVPDLPPLRLGDNLALDFLNTRAKPGAETLDWLGDGPGYVAWLLAFGVISQDDVGHADAGDIAAAAAEARALREWLRAKLADHRAGQEPTQEPTQEPSQKPTHGPTQEPTIEGLECDRLNAIMARAGRVGVLLAGGDGRLRLEERVAFRGPETWLAPVASVIAEFLSAADFSLVRKCDNPACTIWFLDRTKAHRRRWCSAALCGNRAKVAAFRERKAKVGQ